MTKQRFIVGRLFAVMLVRNPAKAGMSINVDEILFQGSDPSVLGGSVLSGDVDMMIAGNVLTITLTNTSSASTGDSAGNLLTGIGFNLPNGVTIGGGGATVPLMSSAIGFSLPVDRDISEEWGYANLPSSGHFHGAIPGQGPVNTAVSSHRTDVTDQFAPGSLGSPGHLGGPDFGLLSGNLPASAGGGQESVQQALVLTLTLDGTIPADFLAGINDGTVALAFGSPTASSVVPEPASMALGALGLAGMAFIRRRRGASKG